MGMASTITVETGLLEGDGVSLNSTAETCRRQIAAVLIRFVGRHAGQVPLVRN